MPTLQRGSSGPAVTDLQNKLRENGFDPGPSDGSFGPGTVRALQAFQQSKGLTADGVLGAQTAAALGLTLPAPVASLIPGVTVAMVCQMFPQTHPANIEQNLPSVLNSLVAPQLAFKSMILMALATIRAETESFLPISEFPSQFNTSPGGPHPFDLYDNRADLGNQGAPDGERFKGRGFIQLTGRANYQAHGNAIGMGNQLIDNPDLANDPDIAARLLASFLKSRQTAIQSALDAGNLAKARALVNGGTTGIDRFTDAYNIGKSVIPDSISA